MHTQDDAARALDLYNAIEDIDNKLWQLAERYRMEVRIWVKDLSSDNPIDVALFDRDDPTGAAIAELVERRLRPEREKLVTELRRLGFDAS